MQGLVMGAAQMLTQGFNNDHCSGCCVELDTNDWIPLTLPWLLKWQTVVFLV